ncbi:MAG: penicillin acylase family protein [Nitrosomonas sp.]|nr:penicillin acylase family protein [Nitrosomonas sp.]
MSRLKKISLITCGGIILAILALSLALYASLPRYTATLELEGLQDSVEIIRDEHAVPHIYANNELDAYYALGFVHAQDRLWQMEFNLRVATGTLAEWFGSSMLPIDRFQRTLGLAGLVNQDFDRLDVHTRAILAAYTQGVNAYRNTVPVPPPEYLFLAASPRIWQAQDSLLLLKQMAWQLSRNYWDELLYVALRQDLSTQELDDLLPSYPDDTPLPPLPDLDHLYAHLTQPAEAILTTAALKPPAHIGSNNWALTGSRTMSGKPVLANDPHLKLTIPALWYLAHISTPDMNLVGATLPGIPAVILGRNDFVAWSFTNTGADSQDLYLERSPHEQPDQYETPDGTARYEIRTETITVRHAQDEHITIRRSRHGPVISESDAEIQALMPDGAGQLSLALNWTGLHPGDITLQFFHKAAHAASARAFLDAARDYQAPLQNIVYADKTGVIGFIAAGRAALRGPENDLQGRVPAPGWLASYDWQGFIPFEQLPQEHAPASDFIATANHDITPAGYPYLIASDWAPPYRVNRITALINQQTNHGLADSQSIQLDTQSTLAERLLPLLLKVQTHEPLAQTILARLKQWDLKMHGNAPEPLIFIEWAQQLASLLYTDKLKGHHELIGDDSPEFLIRVLSNHDAQLRWCKNAAANAADPCMPSMQAAIQIAIAKLSDRYGSDPDTWSWGEAHIATARHPLFGKLPVLGRLTNLISPRSGGRDTVNFSGHFYDEDNLTYIEEVAPNLRAIYDLADQENSIFSLSSGQSGHFFSPYYKNLTNGWIAGHYFPIRTDHGTVTRSAIGRLVINPLNPLNPLTNPN